MEAFSPRVFDQSATDDPTVAPVQLATATDDPVHGDAGKKSHFGFRDGRKFQVRRNEADVIFPIVSIGESPQQGNCSCLVQVVKRCCQAPVESSSGHVCEGPKCGKVEETRESVLVAMFGDGALGWSTVVPESQGGKVSH